MVDTNVRITPQTQLIDLKTGKPTREMFQLLNALNATFSTLGAALIEDAVTNGTTTKAPSSNAVFDGLALKATVAALAAVEAAAAASLTAGLATKQPLDSDLTAIAALATDAYGRSVLTTASAAALRTLAGLGTAATQNTGTSGANVPLLDGANTWSAAQTFSLPVIVPEYTVAGVPSAATYDNGVIIVSNEAGGRTLATSDGTNWRRVSDGAAVS